MSKNGVRGITGRAGLLAIALAAGVLAAGLALGQAAGTTVTGQEKEVFGAKVSTWARTDASGAVTEVGLTLPMAAVEKATMPAAAAAAGSPPAELKPEAVLEFPEVVKKTTFFDSVDLYWEQGGHPPERYLTPHWDIHFFSLPRVTVDKIDCKNLAPVPNDRVAVGYAPPVPPNAPPAQFCVPKMGFHAVPMSEFSGPGVLRAGLFDSVMITTYYDSAPISVEPMLTRALLMKRESFELPVSAFPMVGRKTLFPTTFKATYDKTTDSYQLVFGGLKTTER